MHDNTPPPCHVRGTKPNNCATALHHWIAEGTGPLRGHWHGWRIAGRCLVAPDGTRLPRERVLGLAWRQDAEARLAAARARQRTVDEQPVRVVVVTLAEFRAHRFGAA